jgi:hypothetical protein
LYGADKMRGMKLIVGHGVHFGHYGSAMLLAPKTPPKRADFEGVLTRTANYSKSKIKSIVGQVRAVCEGGTEQAKVHHRK